MSYKISVIIPAYNVEEYIAECLDSLINQTIGIENIEIIIIDDISTDNTINIIEEYTNKYNSIKLIKQNTNQGPGAARNKGLKQATGEYITFLDSDDFISNNTYKHCTSIMDNDKETDMVIYPYKLYNEENKLPPEDIHQKIYKENKIITDLNQYPEIIFSTSPWNKIYSQNLIPYLEFPSMLYEDNITSLKTILKAKKIHLTTEDTYYYRFQEDNSSRSQKVSSKNSLDLIKSIKQILNLKNEYTGNKEIINYLALKFTYDVIFWMLNLDFKYEKRCQILKELKTITKFNEETLNNFEKLFPIYNLSNKEALKDINQLDEVNFFVKYLYMDKYINPQYTATLYINTGNDYNENEKITKTYTLKDEINLDFNLEKYENIKNLRFDPLEGKFSLIEIKEIKTNNNNKIKIEHSNSENPPTDKTQIFITKDPQYIIKTEKEKINNLNIKFHIKIEDVEEVKTYYDNIIKGLREDMEKLNIKVNGLNYEINARDEIIENKNQIIEKRDKTINEMENSTSWKITKPIRKINRN